MKRVEKNVVQAFNDIDINELNKKMMVDNIQFFSFQILDNENLNISENVIVGTDDKQAVDLLNSLPSGVVKDKNAIEEIYYFLVGTEDYVREELNRVANTSKRFVRQFN